MPTIYDNIQTRLLDTLQRRLDEATRADFSVGYFNLRGWRGLADGVDKLPPNPEGSCRLLIGMNEGPNAEVRKLYRLSTSDELMDNKTAKKLKEEMAEEFRNQLTIGGPTNLTEATLKQLKRQLVAKQLRVKLFLDHPLHAKLYLIHRNDDAAPLIGYLGSSNLTLAGLSKQGELNIDVIEQDAAKKLHRWFEDRWNQDWCLDITDELAEIIEESWAGERLLSPYLIYLKIAYHLSEEARIGLSEFKLPKEFEAQLFEFQKAAVKIAAHHLNRRGGVMLGDVVGLGKTMMASALIKMQTDEGGRALIICPKNLEPMWQQYVDDYELNAKIVPLSMVTKELEELKRYRLVVIDESHNLRNREGKGYRAIREYLLDNDSKCVLLSATPYNKEYNDLSSQLGLFIDSDDDIGVRPDFLLREMGEPQFVAKHQCKVKSLKAFEQSLYPDDWRNLMRRFLVRRTRTFIQQNYAEISEDGRAFLAMPDGGRYYFPTRIPKSVKFALDESDPNDQYARMFSAKTEDDIDELRLPRYGLGNYAGVEAALLATPAEETVLGGLARAGKRLIGFSRTNLFKRMESSGHVFLQSVDRHILRNYVFLYALENGLPVPIGTQDTSRLDSRRYDEDLDALTGDFGDDDEIQTDGVAREASIKSEEEYRWEAEHTYEEYRRSYEQSFKWLRPELFDSSLSIDLLHDAQRMMTVQQRSGAWNPVRDEKLNALEQLIRTTHPDEKILVFSQFADTVAYLTDQLKTRGVSRLEGVSGNSTDPTLLAWRFSPSSNDRQQAAREHGELRVLISTDVLSEGQNLQDSAIVVNFDLPWAIIRLIQRAGRVDRLGQESPEILCYSFMPAEGIERIIKLRSRVRQRLNENREVVGADEVFFEGDDNSAPLLDLYSEKAGVLDGEEDTEVDLASYAYQIWKNAKDAHPEMTGRVEKMPNVVYATRANRATEENPDGVLLYARTPDGNDSLARIDASGNTITESPLEILNTAACEPGTPGIARDDRHHDLVLKGVEQVMRDERMMGGQLGKKRGARYRAYERLSAFVKEQRAEFERRNMRSLIAPDFSKVEKVIDALYLSALKASASESLNRLLREGANNEELARHAVLLWEDEKLTVGKDEQPDIEPVILCSLGLFRK